MIESDYFKPFNETIKEANIFLAHKNIRGWLWHQTGRIMPLIPTDEDLEWIADVLWSTAYTLNSKLESYEQYELCQKVTNQLELLSTEINQIQKSR